MKRRKQLQQYHHQQQQERWHGDTLAHAYESVHHDGASSLCITMELLLSGCSWSSPDGKSLLASSISPLAALRSQVLRRPTTRAQCTSFYFLQRTLRCIAKVSTCAYKFSTTYSTTYSSHRFFLHVLLGTGLTKTPILGSGLTRGRGENFI